MTTSKLKLQVLRVLLVAGSFAASSASDLLVGALFQNAAREDCLRELLAAARDARPLRLASAPDAG